MTTQHNPTPEMIYQESGIATLDVFCDHLKRRTNLGSFIVSAIRVSDDTVEVIFGHALSERYFRWHIEAIE